MKNRKVVSKSIALFICVMFLVSACSSFTKTAYSTLGTAAVTYDSSMKIFAELYKKGYINDNEKALAIDVATKYYQTYQLAVSALEVYKQSDDAVRGQKELELQELLTSLSNLGTQLTALVNSFSARTK